MVAYTFGDCVLDTARFEVRRAGTPIPLEPKVFDLLRYLVTHAGTVATKAELIDHVWGDEFVSESALTTNIGAARRAVGDDGRTQRVIRTVHGRGYEFVAPVVSGDVETPVATAGADVPPPRSRLRRKALIGRGRAVDDVLRRLDVAPLVTVVGPAGAGKTHLAAHVADSWTEATGRDSVLVELAAVRANDAVAQHVLDALGRPPMEAETTLEAASIALRAEARLVVLDNCEHVLPAVVDLLLLCVPLGFGGPLLATSRRRLEVPGEQVVNLGGLDHADATALFAARMHELGGAPVGANDPAVAELCRKLDELPLALELAAARARVLGVRNLVARLDDRLRLLHGGVAAGDHRSLEVAIGTSYDDLPAPLQQTLCHLSVFAGAFDLPAAVLLAQVDRDLDDVEAIGHIAELAERSLLVVEDVPERTQYRLLESVRLFAADRLELPDAVQDAHVVLFRRLAARRQERCDTPAFEHAWREAAADWSNYRVAVEWGLERGQTDDVLALLAATAAVAHRLQRFEHGSWADRALEQAGPDHPSVAPVLAGLAALRANQDRIGDVVRLAEAAGRPSDGHAVAYAHFLAAWGQGLHDEAARLLELMDTQVRGSGGMDELAVQSWRQVLATFGGAELGDADQRTTAVAGDGPVGRVFVLNMQVRQALRDRDSARAVVLSEALADAATESGLLAYRSAALLNRSHALQTLEVSDRTADLIRTGMVQQRSLGYWTAVRPDSAMAAKILLARGRAEDAATIIGGCESLSYRGHGSSLIAQVRAEASSALGDDFASAFRRGQQLSAPQLCDFVIARLATMSSLPDTS